MVDPRDQYTCGPLRAGPLLQTNLDAMKKYATGLLNSPCCCTQVELIEVCVGTDKQCGKGKGHGNPDDMEESGVGAKFSGTGELPMLWPNIPVQR